MQAVVAADSHLGVVPPDVGPSAHAWAHANVDPAFVVFSVAAASTACLVGAPPMAQADPVATTALVLKVVDGDTVDIRGWTVHTVVATLD